MRPFLLLACMLLPCCESSPLRQNIADNVSVAATVTRPRQQETGSRANVGAAADRSAQLTPLSIFFGQSDETYRRSLREQPITEIEKGRGGRSLAFKLTLADGTQGYYKPEQTFSGSHWYAELMAYYLDRELGFGRVPPVVGRSIDWSRLKPFAKGDKRIAEIIVQPDGTVRGAFIWWLPKKPTRLVTGRNWERWIRVEGPLHISPYQAPIDWRRDRKSGKASQQHWPTAGVPAKPERPGELSDMIIFDYLATNVDRWGGNNENVRTLGEGGSLLFFDNGAGFSPGRARIPLMDSRLHALQRYVPRTRERLEELDLKRLQKRMKADPLFPFLPDRSWTGFVQRLEHARQYLAQLESQFGSASHLQTTSSPGNSSPKTASK